MRQSSALLTGSAESSVTTVLILTAHTPQKNFYLQILFHSLPPREYNQKKQHLTQYREHMFTTGKKKLFHTETLKIFFLSSEDTIYNDKVNRYYKQDEEHQSIYLQRDNRRNSKTLKK